MTRAAGTPRTPDPAIPRHFARGLVAFAGLPPGKATDRLEDAFAAVPRERHAGPGPWQLIAERGPSGRWTTPDDDPAWLYHDVLVSLDAGTGVGINMGGPSMWAAQLGALGIRPGTRVLQVGAGTGYYTAVIAHLAGLEGGVTAMEVEPRLAARAADALTDVPNASVVEGNAATDPPPGPYDLVVAFAGVTHPVPAWIDALAEGGRMLLPVTGASGWGAFTLFEREGSDRLRLATLGRCGFYPCAGARDEALAERWDRVLRGDAVRGMFAAMERRTAGADEVALPGGWAARRMEG